MQKITQSHQLNGITLFKRSTLIMVFIFSIGNIFGQYTFQGTITDDSGEPLIGASILIKGTTTGTVTDFDGSFTLLAADSLVTLVISYTGFSTMELDFSSPKKLKRGLKGKHNTTINLQNLSVEMEENVAQLSEVVVTGLGVKKEKKSLGYGITTITPDRTQNRTASSGARKRTKKKTEELNKVKGDATVKDDFSNIQYYVHSAESPDKAIAKDKIIIRNMPRKPNPKKSENTHPFPQNVTKNRSEGYELIQENEFLTAIQNPLSTFSIDVDAASYSNMRRFIQSHQTPPRDAIRIEEMINYFNYEYPNPQGEHPFEVITEISECPWNNQNRLVHIGLQGKKIAWEELPPSNTVFLIDVSGSMSYEKKLPLLKQSFEMLVDQLRSQDKVAIVVYAGAAGMVLNGTPGDQKHKIKTAIQNLTAGGSTAGGAGIKLAYKMARENFIQDGNNRIILATDGDFNVGVNSDSELVRMIEEERKSGVFLTVLGFGTGNYQDAKMQKLADHGNGNHAYIDNIREAKKVLVEEFGGTMFTIAKDVKIQIEFNPSKVQAYRLIGYENRMLAAEDFNDDTKDAGELGAGHTVTALYEIIPQGISSDFVKSVDKLKYQSGDLTETGISTNELMTIKLRYKAPDGDISQLIEKPVIDAQVPINKTSENFRWSASVAQFGMLLRNSKFKENSTYASCLNLAQDAKGYDLNNYRAEMIGLVKVMKSIADPDLAGK